MANSAGRFYNESSVYKLLELVEVKRFIEEHSLVTYWCESSYELFIYNNENLLEVIAYIEGGYLFIEIAYPKHSKNCNLDHLYFEVYEQCIQSSRKQYQDIISNQDNQDSVIGDIKSQALFLSLLDAMEFFSNAFFDESYCSELFSSIPSSDGLYFVKDRITEDSKKTKVKL
ncbi:hypothetical protein AB6E04_06980 [Vibrio amylolyticus]|uniref:hypothetical protein n=1 Tax=Vibrio amylolyticus TaxID=2847292 RepID=UPI0035528A2B